MSKQNRIGRSCLLVILSIIAVTSVSAAERRPAWTTSRVTGTPSPPAPFRIQRAFGGLEFQRPTSLQQITENRFLVTEIGGRAYTFQPSGPKTPEKSLLFEIEGASVWHATVHPRFSENGRIFVCYSRSGTTHLSRINVAMEPPVADLTTEEVLLTWPAGGHNGGCLAFGTDGMLYVSTGDGSGPNPPDGRTAAQDVTNLFGCILRIDVDRPGKTTAYSIPNDNPFKDLEGARPEVWSYGLRNPWKFGIDSQSGRVFAADNGWESWEMIHEIVRGGNCGWPIMEGRAILRSEVKRGPTEIRPPVKDHPHSEANSVIGGPVYRGTKLKDLVGTFVYGDYITGTIWGLTLESDGEFSHRTLVDTDQRITAFAEGRQGELYVLDYDLTGGIYELTPSGLKDTSATFPRKLSETGLFKSLDKMIPADGVIPYDVVVRRWMDGHATRRWVAIPGDASIQLGDSDSPAAFPDGTVFVKHVTLDSPKVLRKNVPVETQLLHFENGVWHPYSYAWNSVLDDDEELDATLVDEIGMNRQVVHSIDEYSKPFGPNWHHSAVNECRLCHNAGAGFVLGFNAQQLRRSVFRLPPQHIVHQLEHLADEETIAGLPAVGSEDPGRLVDPFDDQFSLDDRARSYLHGNCSSCHHPRGNAIVSFFLRRELPFEKLKTNKGTGIGTFGIDNAKLIVPGDPYRSILLYRMSKLGYGRMPYIGSRAVDSRGVALIEQWIREMPHEDSEQDSPLVQKSSDEAGRLEQLKRMDRAPLRIDAPPADKLLGSTEGALAVALGMHSGAFRGPWAKAVYDSSPGDIAGLFADFVPEGQRRATLGRSPKPERILELKGQQSRGRLIFFSDSARCRQCHHETDQSQSTGPTLAEVRKKYPRRTELLQHILNPSLKIEDKFATWIVVTDEGKVLSGLLKSQSDTEVVLKSAEGKTQNIPRDSIDQMQKSPRSLMPDSILSDLTAQEAADLLEWLQTE